MAYLNLIRPLNVMLAAGAVLIASLVAVGADVMETGSLLPVLLACFAAGLVTAAGNVLNDYSDMETDKVNHPERPIPSGSVSAESALWFSTILFVVSLPFAFMVNLECFLLAGLNILTLISYERSLKRKGLPGNIEVSWLTSSIFIFGGLAVYDGDLTVLSRTLHLAIMAFFASMGREITKDIEDVEGDVDRLTLPKMVGIKGASRVGAASFWLAVLFSLVPTITGLFGWYYVPIVLVANIIFIYSATLITRNPKRGSKLAKVGMAIALIAFLTGGLT